MPYHVSTTAKAQPLKACKRKPQPRHKSRLTRLAQQWRIACRLSARDQRWMLENMPAMVAQQDITQH